jgi:hypothetical protein
MDSLKKNDCLSAASFIFFRIDHCIFSSVYPALIFWVRFCIKTKMNIPLRAEMIQCHSAAKNNAQYPTPHFLTFITIDILVGNL